MEVAVRPAHSDVLVPRGFSSPSRGAPITSTFSGEKPGLDVSLNLTGTHLL